MNVVGLDVGHTNIEEAEHWLHDHATVLGLGSPLGPEAPIACTHLVRGPRPRIALSVSGAPPLPAWPPIDPAVAASVASDHEARRDGRAVRYPGVDELVGVLTVGELLGASAIDRVVVLGGPPPEPGTPVDTRGFVRPQWKDGLLTLIATPSALGQIAPFEIANPPRCCETHW